MKTGLGLKPGEVALCPPSADWASAFEAEKAKLARLLDGLVLDIQHVGSTAVPELEAKPIIDIAMAIADDSVVDRISERLLANGYHYAVNAGSDGGHIFFRETAGNVRTHHLHVINVDDSQWSNYLKFRERLRKDPDLRADYAKLKAELACKYARDREAYTLAKADFIQRVLTAVD